MKIFMLGILVSFIMVFLKGFQHQNVIGMHYKLAFIFSYLMAITDVCLISLVVINTWSMIIPIGLGSSTGIITSMFVYNKYVRKV